MWFPWFNTIRQTGSARVRRALAQERECQRVTEEVNQDSPRFSSNHFKYGLSIAGISFFATAAMIYHTASKAQDNMKSEEELAQSSAPSTVPPGYTSVTQRLTPEEQQAIDAHNQETEESFRKFSGY